MKILKSENSKLKHRVEKAEETIDYLISKTDDIEQYSRRTSIRFFNVNQNYKLTTPSISTDTNASSENQQMEPSDNSHHSNQTSDITNQPDAKVSYENIILDICNEKINVSPPISGDDIERVHPVGSAKDGKIQLLCKFKSWKVKHRVFAQKKNLKPHKSKNFHVFLSEDLTKNRQQIVRSLEDARRNNYIMSHWTNDGRIFYKQNRNSGSVLINHIDQVHELIR